MGLKLSLMITSFNCADSIDNAIESVIKQEKPFEWELLIGDDGSNDGTIEKIKKWEEQYPYNIKSYSIKRGNEKSKSGLRAARNRANLLLHSSGEYCAFLDGDDQLLGTDKFIKQIEILEKDTEKKISGVAHNILAVEYLNNKEYLMVDQTVSEGIVDSKRYWSSMYFHTNTIIFRKCCKEMMLNEKYRDYLNDNFITYIILQYGRIYYLKDTYAQYNITGNGLWTGKKRVFGCFRNIMLYDLERAINPGMKKCSFKRHLYDLLYISRNYKKEEDTNVIELIEDVNRNDFPITFLLANIIDVKRGDGVKRFFLVNAAEAYNIINHVIHIKEYISKNSNG